ncbi:hypothetical protein ACFYWX_29840 [Streptomyces sp. NPDC002888]|uniref:hypothetical protein n=1 Tax=Streptomyces sp. NPDC002888 TaxID=3364668 RepID=UPI0036BBB54F
MTRDPEPRTFGTRQLRTRVEPAGAGRFRWTRTRLRGELGPAAPPGFPESEPHMVLGTRSGKDTAYLCRGDLSLAQLIWPPGRFNLPPSAAATATAAAGQALRRIADHPSTALPPPPALTRLEAWLSTGEGPGEAPRLHTLTRAHLGVHRLQTLGAWIRDLHERPPVLLHGEPSLGLIVLPREGVSPPVLLTGESLSSGPPEFDTGWLLGELAEMADIAHRNAPHQDSVALLSTMAQSLLDARGPLETPLLARVATLRRLTHLLDFAAHVNWNPGVESSLLQLASLIDEEGTSALDLLRVTQRRLP